MKTAIHTPTEWKQGDILVDKEGDKCKILGICGDAYFISLENDFGWINHSIYTKEELEGLGYELEEEKTKT